ncbi:MAG TPA: glycosyltransferase [Candidatus Bathyarchaeia archaeon]|nr:glycosyltransferase [Candidatus Bathyarchaeia archaeon]
MNIVMVTSWSPRHCGIATYSSELVGALRKNGHHVDIICHTDEEFGGHREESVYPVIDTNDPGWDEKVFASILQLKPDVVHIQHEYGLYLTHGDYGGRILPLLFRLKLEKVPSVMTYHSIYTSLDRPEAMFTDVSLRLLDSAIVHAEVQKLFLPYNLDWIPHNVHVISHGAKEVVPDPLAKERFGLAGKKVALCIGWFEPNKRFEDVVEIWPEVVREAGESAILLIAGDARPGSSTGIKYKEQLLRKIDVSPAKDHIKTILGAFDPDTYDSIISASDFVVLPYKHASQSGNLAHSFALNKPAIVSSLEGLKAEIEASGAGIAVPVDDLEELRKAVTILLTSDLMLETYSQHAQGYVANYIIWENVARKHTLVYENAIDRVTYGTKMRVNQTI